MLPHDNGRSLGERAQRTEEEVDAPDRVKDALCFFEPMQATQDQARAVEHLEAGRAGGIVNSELCPVDPREGGNEDRAAGNESRPQRPGAVGMA